MTRLVLVVPCYNEGRRLDLPAFQKFLKRSADVDFVFVNDGSVDDTESRLRLLQSEAGPRVHVLTLSTNQGKAEAVRLGLREALPLAPDFVGFWDADLATPLAEVDRFVRLLHRSPEVDAVIGARVRLMGHDIVRRPWRHYSGRVFATCASLLLRLPVYDTQCGAKVFRANGLIAKVIEEPFKTRWLFDVEILARYITNHPHGLGGVHNCLYELPVKSWADVEMTSLTLREYVRAAFSLTRILIAYGPALRRAARDAATS